MTLLSDLMVRLKKKKNEVKDQWQTSYNKQILNKQFEKLLNYY